MALSSRDRSPDRRKEWHEFTKSIKVEDDLWPPSRVFWVVASIIGALLIVVAVVGGVLGSRKSTNGGYVLLPPMCRVQSRS